MLSFCSSDMWRRWEEKSRVEEEEVLKTEQSGGIRSPFFQIKETYSLPGLLGTDTAISRTPAYSSLQVGSTFPPWRTDRMQLRSPMEKAECGWATHTGLCLWIPLCSLPRSAWQICSTKRLSKECSRLSHSLPRLKTTGQEEQTERAGSDLSPVRFGNRRCPWLSRLNWCGLAWGQGNGQNDLHSSRPARWVYEKRLLIHSRALPKWLWNIPRQLPGESMVGKTKSQEPGFGVSSHSFQILPLKCFPLCLSANSLSLINCKTPEGRGSFLFSPLLPCCARPP